MRMTPEALKLMGTVMKPEKVTALTLRDAAWARAALADGSTLTGERFPAEDVLPKHFMTLLEDGAKRGTSASAAAWSAWALALTSQTAAEKTLPDTVNLVCRRLAEGFDGTTDLKRTGGAVTLSAPGCVEFAVENVEKTALSEPLYFSLVSVGAPKALPAAPISEGLSVTKRYLNAEGKEASVFRTGERVTVEIRIVGTGELVLADPIPGGFMHADRPGAAPEIEDASTRGFQRADDRFVVRLTPYGTAEDGVTTLRYTLRAVTPGTFAAGPAALEDAADGAKRAQGVMATLKVE